MTGRGDDAPASTTEVTEGEKPGTSPLSDAARDAMITDNLGLAHQLARRFLHRGEPLEDLVQEGMLGLIRAVE